MPRPPIKPRSGPASKPGHPVVIVPRLQAASAIGGAALLLLGAMFVLIFPSIGWPLLIIGFVAYLYAFQ